jgi:peptidoglycan hydrolase CwlO-like protein
MTIDERIEFLLQSIESHNRQIGENTEHIANVSREIHEISGQIRDLKDSISKLVEVSNKDATAIRALARIAEAHEGRISRIETER